MLKKINVKSKKFLIGVFFISLILILTNLINFNQIQYDVLNEREDFFFTFLSFDINLKSMSLFLVALFIGFVDGFNPCAMWVLIYLITILSQLDSKKKMILICSIFLLTSGIIYFLILLIWLLGFSFFSVFSFSSYLILAVGGFSVGFGIYMIYEYIIKKGFLECKVDFNKRAKIKKRIQKIVNSNLTILSIFGIIFLAFTINSIEFFCSFGLPAIFTQFLQASDILFLEKLFYIFVYVIAFMIDDIIVFTLAIYAINTDFLHKYSGISHLVGGVILVLLGLYLLFFL